MAKSGGAPRHVVVRRSARHRDLSSRKPGAELVRVKAEHARGVFGDGSVQGYRLMDVVALLFLRHGLGVLQIAQVHDARQDPQHAVHGGRVEADGLQGVTQPREVGLVARLEAAEHGGAAAVVGQQPVRPDTVEAESFQPRVVEASQHLVEAMVRPLAVAVGHHTGALEQVSCDACTNQGPSVVEVDAVVLAEARGVGVPHRGRVAE
mmetsp:Transcript_119042/g.342049  ORF Transcript_119042/g.342049 Transcript_119042/m.342049 type:complete len:207 (-) Transcript_119042:673-1293(-)